MKHQHLVRFVALSLPLATVLPQVHAAPRVTRPAVRQSVVSGIVSRVVNSREFDVRVGARSVRVRSYAFQNLKPGDYVVARGQLRGNTMRAETVTRRDDNVRGNQGRETVLDFRGQVVEVEGAQSLRVRATNKRTYAVRTVGAMNRLISRGDTVRVRGTFDGSFVRADNGAVILLVDSDSSNGGIRNGTRVNFRATVTRLLRRGQIEVRNAKGQILVVHAPAALIGYVRVGDQVRVQGVTRTGFVEASNIDRVR